MNKSDIFEKVNIYIKTVECIARKNGLNVATVSDITEPIKAEIFNLDISPKESFSEKFLGKLYLPLISSVSFAIEHPILFKGELDKLNLSTRKRIQIEESKSKKPNFVDFFAGAGGLSCGFTQAGFKVEFANDFEEVCVKTYRYNHPELPQEKVLQEDIRKIADNISDYVNCDVDVVVGGPPCQGFSSANQQRIIDDPRNELYKYFLKAVSAIAPKFVVMENVKGMLKVADQVKEDYEKIEIKKKNLILTYKVSCRLLNSADFSVAQSRERLIFIAIRSDIQEKFSINPDDVFEQIDNANLKKEHFVLGDALSGLSKLDAPNVKGLTEIDSEKTGYKIGLNQFEGRENSYVNLLNSNKKLQLVYNHKSRFLNELNHEIYRRLEQGDDAADPKISDIMPYKNRLHCFKDKYFKLIEDKPSRTITAHLKMDGHSHIHPTQIRSLTPREAARCQSFPDDYLFLGAYLKTYMQIGNAVPCLMAKGIAEALKRYLK